MKKQIVHQENEEEVSLKGVVLTKRKEVRRTQHHLYVTDTTQRSNGNIIQEVVLSLNEFLTQRSEIDKELIAIVKPFVNLNADTDLNKVHQAVCPDLSLEDLSQ